MNDNVVDGEQQGVSPKVKIPAIALGVVGVILLVAGSVVDGLGDTREVGLGLVLSSPLAGFLGFNAPTGTIRP